MPINNNRKPIQLLLLTSLIWGISFPIIKASLQFLPPLPLLWYRLSIASLIFAPLAIYGWKTSGEYLSFRRTLLITLLGLSGPIASLTLLYLGMNLTYASRAVLIMSLNPLITAVILNWSNRQINKISWSILAAAAGLIIVIFEPIWLTGRPDYSRFTGNLLVLSAGLVWAVSTWLSKIKYVKNIQRNSLITLVALAFLGGAMALAPVVYFINPNYILTPLSFILTPKLLLYGILYLSLISSVMGFMAFEAAAKLVKPLIASRFLYMQALFGIPVAILFLKEPLSLAFLAATGIITLGIIGRENENKHTSSILSGSSSSLRLRQ